MNKKFLIFTFIALIGVFNLFLINTVKAYEENAFTGEECLTEDSWLSTAKTEYQLNQTTGKYELSGMTASEYKQSTGTEQAVSYVFYGVSEDGKTLTAYVPSYNSGMKTDFVRNMVNNAGVITTADCAGTLKVTKTVVGDSSSSGTEGTNQPSDGGTVDKNDTVEKVSAPNTASPASIAAVVIGIGMVALAAYILLKKNNKLPFIKNN